MFTKMLDGGATRTGGFNP